MCTNSLNPRNTGCPYANALLGEFDNLRRELDHGGVIAGMDKFQRQALEVLTSRQLGEALDSTQEANPENTSDYPDRGREKGRDRLRRHQRCQADLSRLHGPAGVPRSETDEGVEEHQRRGEQRQDARGPGPGQQQHRRGGQTQEPQETVDEGNWCARPLNDRRAGRRARVGASPCADAARPERRRSNNHRLSSDARIVNGASFRHGNGDDTVDARR